MPWYDLDNACSELEYDNNGTLTIDFNHEYSDAVCYLSEYASIVRNINLDITFPDPDYDDSDTTRVRRELDDIVSIINNDFTNVYGFNVSFYLKEFDINQLSCALAFRRLHLSGCMFSYYVDDEWRGTFEIDTDWYGELEDEYGAGDRSNYYGCDSDEEGYTWDTDSD